MYSLIQQRTLYELSFTSISSCLALGFCRDGTCSFAPITPLGGTCINDDDCEGTVFGLPVFCSPSGKCGGAGSACLADDGTADGYSEGCTSGEPDYSYIDQTDIRNALLNSMHSGICSARVCTAGTGPSPNVNAPGSEKRTLERQRMFGEICPRGLVACPFGRKRYEVSFMLVTNGAGTDRLTGGLSIVHRYRQQHRILWWLLQC